ncbi:MAG: DUF2975 domain-containing protein [bacterium]|nr:DUF2975 domain-containing protein [bacterium]
MKWSFGNSIFLTKISIAVFSVAYLAVVVTCPVLVRWFLAVSSTAEHINGTFFMATIYMAAVPIGILLWMLRQLISDIGKEEIFTYENIRRLRGISWMCILVAVICLVSMGYYLFWGVIGACMAFMGLLIRVIKNVFERAKQLKDENDYTI